MKRKLGVIGAATLVAVALTACGHDNSDTGMSTTPPPPPPAAPTNAMLATSAILSDYALKPTETGAPVAVNDGAFTITETSETTQPIGVNGN